MSTAPAPDDSKRCPECKSTNLKLVSTREHLAKGDAPDAPVLARTLHIQCRRCKASWDILRRVTSG